MNKILKYLQLNRNKQVNKIINSSQSFSFATSDESDRDKGSDNKPNKRTYSNYNQKRQKNETGENNTYQKRTAARSYLNENENSDISNQTDYKVYSNDDFRYSGFIKKNNFFRTRYSEIFEFYTENENSFSENDYQDMAYYFFRKILFGQIDSSHEIFRKVIRHIINNSVKSDEFKEDPYPYIVFIASFIVSNQAINNEVREFISDRRHKVLIQEHFNSNKGNELRQLISNLSFSIVYNDNFLLDKFLRESTFSFDEQSNDYQKIISLLISHDKKLYSNRPLKNFIFSYLEKNLQINEEFNKNINTLENVSKQISVVGLNQQKINLLLELVGKIDKNQSEYDSITIIKVYSSLIKISKRINHLYIRKVILNILEIILVTIKMQKENIKSNFINNILKEILNDLNNNYHDNSKNDLIKEIIGIIATDRTIFLRLYNSKILMFDISNKIAFKNDEINSLCNELIENKFFIEKFNPISHNEVKKYIFKVPLLKEKFFQVINPIIESRINTQASSTKFYSSLKLVEYIVELGLGTKYSDKIKEIVNKIILVMNEKDEKNLEEKNLIFTRNILSKFLDLQIDKDLKDQISSEIIKSIKDNPISEFFINKTLDILFKDIFYYKKDIRDDIITSIFPKLLEIKDFPLKLTSHLNYLIENDMIENSSKLLLSLSKLCDDKIDEIYKENKENTIEKVNKFIFYSFKISMIIINNSSEEEDMIIPDNSYYLLLSKIKWLQNYTSHIKNEVFSKNENENETETENKETTEKKGNKFTINIIKYLNNNTDKRTLTNMEINKIRFDFFNKVLFEIVKGNKHQPKFLFVSYLNNIGFSEIIPLRNKILSEINFSKDATKINILFLNSVLKSKDAIVNEYYDKIMQTFINYVKELSSTDEVDFNNFNNFMNIDFYQKIFSSKEFREEILNLFKKMEKYEIIYLMNKVIFFDNSKISSYIKFQLYRLISSKYIESDKKINYSRLILILRTLITLSDYKSQYGVTIKKILSDIEFIWKTLKFNQQLEIIDLLSKSNNFLYKQINSLIEDGTLLKFHHKIHLFKIVIKSNNSQFIENPFFDDVKKAIEQRSYQIQTLDIEQRIYFSMYLKYISKEELNKKEKEIEYLIGGIQFKGFSFEDKKLELIYLLKITNLIKYIKNHEKVSKYYFIIHIFIISSKNTTYL